jgi:integrase
MSTKTKKKSKEEKIHGIRQIGPGLFIVRVETINPRTGLAEDVRKRVHCQTMAEAVVERVKLLTELKQGGPAGNARQVRLGDYARSWLTGRLPTLKASTAARYADTLDRFILPGLGDFYLDVIDGQDVQKWFSDVSANKAASTANGYLRVLKVLVADAVAQYKLPFNPTARIRAIPERGREEMESDDPVNMLTQVEMARFVAALRSRWPQWFTMLYLQFALACRFSDISAMMWTDVNWKKGILRIRRGNWRTIVSSAKIDRLRNTHGMTEEMRTILEAWREELVRSKHRHLDSGWMFPSKVGKPHHNSSCLTKVFKDCLKAIGVERRFSSHGLRRTANNILRKLYGGETARAITGHVTVKMTEHYSHVDVDEKRAAVEGMLSLVRGGDETPPSNENHIAQDITGEAETGEAKTGTLAGTSTEKTGSSEESVAEGEKKTA